MTTTNPDIERCSDENPNPIFRVAADGRVSYANPQAQGILALLDWTPERTLGEPFLDPIRAALAGSASKEFEFSFPDGREIAFSLIPNLNCRHVDVYGFDVGRLRLRERKLDRLNRTLRAIQHAGQALVRSADESAYLDQVCRHVVEDCGHFLVWIGFVEAHQSIQAVAWASHDHVNTRNTQSYEQDRLLGFIHADAAVQNGATEYCHDTLEDPRLSPWRELLDVRGYRSILALPLLAGGRAFAILAIYADRPYAFSDREIALLEELADDLAFGIQTIRLRQAHTLTESALRLSQSDLNRAQSVGHIGSWRIDIKRNQLGFSLENHRIFELPEDMPLTYESFLTAVHPDDRDYFDYKWQVALEGEPFDFEHRLLIGGRVKWVRERAELEFDSEGQLIGGFGTTQDITQNKSMEEALLRSETRFRELVEHTSDGIFVHDAGGHFLDVNQAGAEMYGYTRQEILLLGITDLLMPEDFERMRTLLAEGQSGQVVRAEWLGRRKDGSSFIAEVVVRKLHDGRSQAIVRDITDRRRNEADRLIALERQRDVLIREVHHRIKNHLQGVIALMRNRIDTMPELSGPLGEAISQIDTIAQVYGLQCRGEGYPVTVDSLVAISVRSAGGAVLVDSRTGLESRPAGLRANEIVPVALVINELITNAIKHTDPESSVDAVHVSMLSSDDMASIRIRNGPARLPLGFDFESGEKLGTGLELVRGLLPPQGASLRFRQEGEAVVVDFSLQWPVLQTGLDC